MKLHRSLCITLCALLSAGTPLALNAEKAAHQQTEDSAHEITIDEAKEWIHQEILNLHEGLRAIMVKVNPKTPEEADRIIGEYHETHFERFVQLRYMQDSVAEIEAAELAAKLSSLESQLNPPESTTSGSSDEARYQKAYHREIQIQKINQIKREE